MKQKKKRPRLTHFEVRRAGHLRLRLAIADDAFTDDDTAQKLGALIRAVAPAAVATKVSHKTQSVQIADETVAEIDDDDPGFFVSPQHAGDDREYHDNLRESLVDLFGALCEQGLEDAIEIVRAEQARRSYGSN